MTPEFLPCGCPEGEGCPQCAPWGLWGPSRAETLMARAEAERRTVALVRRLDALEPPRCPVCEGTGELWGWCCTASPSRAECACGGRMQAWPCDDCAGTGVAR